MQRSKSAADGKKVRTAEDTSASTSPSRLNAMPENRPKNAPAQVLLRNMTIQQRGIISKVDARGELGRRIRDMGLVPGTPIEVQGRAPLKDPVTVKLRDCTLALRNNEADQIWVEVEDVQNG